MQLTGCAMEGELVLRAQVAPSVTAGLIRLALVYKTQGFRSWNSRR